jgi:hypothetical protein
LHLLFGGACRLPKSDSLLIDPKKVEPAFSGKKAYLQTLLESGREPNKLWRSHSQRPFAKSTGLADPEKHFWSKKYAFL